MSTRARHFDALVTGREDLTPHLVRLTLSGDGLASFESTGVPDEWVGVMVPGQFQSRYYTVRSWDGACLVVDVVLHDVGLVTEWARGDVVGQGVTITEPKGSFALPTDATWLLLVGDLTALPAMARIAEHALAGPAAAATAPTAALRPRIWAEVPEELPGYLPSGADVTWVSPQPGPDGPRSALARVVEELDWPAGDGYFWMAGESAQMRAIRKHLMHDRHLPATAYDVMGYWRAGVARQPRAVDPRPGAAAVRSAGGA